MTDTECEQAGCEGKHQYDSHKEACRGMRNLVRHETLGKGLKANVYKCRHCGMWHVGTTEATKHHGKKGVHTTDATTSIRAIWRVMRGMR